MPTGTPLSIFVLLSGVMLYTCADSAHAADNPTTMRTAAEDMDDYQLAARASKLSPAAAKELESRIAANPTDRIARIKLMGFYFTHSLTSADDRARQEHALWWIENQPDTRLAGSPYVQLGPEEGDAYLKGKEIWQNHVAKHPTDPLILDNAGSYLARNAPAEAEKLWVKASQIEPENPEWLQKLGDFYNQSGVSADSQEAGRKLAKQALQAYESALRLTQSDEGRFYLLGDLARAALRCADYRNAKDYASQLLETAQNYRNNWNYGNAIHDGNLVLGQIALAAGDVDLTKKHLIAAGNTPGSPQLNSFGPDMSLARALLLKGEKTAVVEYLHLCGRFWKMDRGALKRWEEEIGRGVTPDFGRNQRN